MFKPCAFAVCLWQEHKSKEVLYVLHFIPSNTFIFLAINTKKMEFKIVAWMLKGHLIAGRSSLKRAINLWEIIVGKL